MRNKWEIPGLAIILNVWEREAATISRSFKGIFRICFSFKVSLFLETIILSQTFFYIIFHLYSASLNTALVFSNNLAWFLKVWHVSHQLRHHLVTHFVVNRVTFFFSFKECCVYWQSWVERFQLLMSALSFWYLLWLKRYDMWSSLNDVISSEVDVMTNDRSQSFNLALFLRRFVL